MYSGYPIFYGGASQQQIGQAAQLRYGPGSADMPYHMRRDLNAIVHSGDVQGPFAGIPNRFRDPSGSFDPAAQAVLDAASKR